MVQYNTEQLEQPVTPPPFRISYYKY